MANQHKMKLKLKQISNNYRVLVIYFCSRKFEKKKQSFDANLLNRNNRHLDWRNVSVIHLYGECNAIRSLIQ